MLHGGKLSRSRDCVGVLSRDRRRGIHWHRRKLGIIAQLPSLERALSSSEIFKSHCLLRGTCLHQGLNMPRTKQDERMSLFLPIDYSLPGAKTKMPMRKQDCVAWHGCRSARLLPNYLIPRKPQELRGTCLPCQLLDIDSPR